jgi:hypothetical protein
VHSLCQTFGTCRTRRKAAGGPDGEAVGPGIQAVRLGVETARLGD